MEIYLYEDLLNGKISIEEYLQNYEEPDDDTIPLSIINNLMDNYNKRTLKYYSYRTSIDFLLFNKPFLLKRENLHKIILEIVKEKLKKDISERYTTIETASSIYYMKIADQLSKFSIFTEYNDGLIGKYVNAFLKEELINDIITFYKNIGWKIKNKYEALLNNSSKSVSIYEIKNSVSELYSTVFTYAGKRYFDDKNLKYSYSIFDFYKDLLPTGLLDYLDPNKKESYIYENILKYFLNRYKMNTKKNPSFKDWGSAIASNFSQVCYLIEGLYLSKCKKYSDDQLYIILKPLMVECLTNMGGGFANFVKNKSIMNELKNKLDFSDKFMSNLILDSYIEVICNNKYSMVRTVIGTLIRREEEIIDKMAVNENIDKRVKKLIIQRDILKAEGE